MAKQRSNSEEIADIASAMGANDSEIEKLLMDLPVLKHKVSTGGVKTPGEELEIVKGSSGSFAVKPFTGNFTKTSARAEVRVVCNKGSVTAVYKLNNKEWAQLKSPRGETLPSADPEAWKAHLEGRFYNRHIL